MPPTASTAAASPLKALVEAGKVDVIVAWHLDRLTRSMVELEAIITLAEAHNTIIATVTCDLDLSTTRAG